MSTSIPSTDTHNIQEHPDEISRSDEEAIQKLKDLFEHQAGSTSLGCRDTIDSILLRYATVRDEIRQDPRIGLVLGTELEKTSFHSSTVRVEEAHTDTIMNRLSGTRSRGHAIRQNDEEHRSENSSPHQYLDGTEARARQATGFRTKVDEILHIDHISLMDTSLQHSESEGTDAMWSDEDTLLDVYAQVDDDVFRTDVESAITIADTSQGADTSTMTKPDRKFPKWPLIMTKLSMSPIMQVDMVVPLIPEFSNTSSVDILLTSSEEGGNAKNVATSTEAVSAPARTPDAGHVTHDVRTWETIETDAVSQLLRNLEDLQSKMNEVLVKHKKSRYKRTHAFDKQDVEDANLSLPTIDRDTEHAKMWHVEDAVTPPKSPKGMIEGLETKQKHQKVDTTSSLLASLDSVEDTEYVLNAGLVIMLSVVGLAGRVLW